MVQILERVPSFGEKLAPTLASAIGDIAKGYQQKRTNEQDNKILEGLTSNPNASPMDQIKAISGLSKAKQDVLVPFFTKMLESKQKQEAAQVKQQEAIAKEQRQKESVIEKEQRDIQNKKIVKEEEKQERLGSAFDVVRDLEKKKEFVGHAFGHKSLQKERQHIKTAAISLEGLFRDLSTKGTVPLQVFNTIKALLPNPDMTEEQYQGSINGIKDVLKSQGFKFPEESDQEKRPSLESFYQ